MKKRYFLTLIIFIPLFGCNKDIDLVPKEPLIEGPTLIELETPTNPFFGNYKIPNDNIMSKEGVELGRMLFYEKQLSGDNTMSCGSCHKQEFAFTDGKAVSAGIDGLFGNRSTMTIVNAVWDDFFFWDGRAASLEEQALGPIENPIELHETLENAVSKLQNSTFYPQKFKNAFGDTNVTSERIGMAIAQFERTLISSNSKFDKFLRGELDLTESEMRGFEKFATHPVAGQIRGGNCGDCHLGYTFTNDELKNNGVDVLVNDKGLELITGDTSDRGKFKVPSLRNIELTAPYMHDGRFATLEEVMDHYNDTSLFNHENVDFQILAGTNEPNGKSLLLNDQEKEDIIAFLKTLTDEEFISNEAFSDPF